jgi:hypothetical protein
MGKLLALRGPRHKEAPRILAEEGLAFSRLGTEWREYFYRPTNTRELITIQRTKDRQAAVLIFKGAGTDLGSKFWTPRRVGIHHRVEDDEELPHSGEDDFGGFAGDWRRSAMCLKTGLKRRAPSAVM